MRKFWEETTLTAKLSATAVSIIFLGVWLKQPTVWAGVMIAGFILALFVAANYFSKYGNEK